ncbi:DNA cytosine methyltransferase [Mycoplasma sp. VS428]|uniref:DNA cytosine methyltransferase n=1 Tax=Mycoplasma sp. VS428 TaxID=3401684 RepID=UPI003AAEADD4
MKREKKKQLTYISLFSSAGVGCYGFKQNGFECVATNEIIQRRMNIQVINKKCKYESGYIVGDITTDEIKNKILEQVEFWKKNENINSIDVLIATPPCQGMSVANHKKNLEDINRNSLVIESIEMIKKIKPKIFIFENVSSFLKTLCVDIDENIKPIEEAIFNSLSNIYNIEYRVLNFKNYGSNSSRQRTLVIGTQKELSNKILPSQLFPDESKQKTIFEVIGHLKSLKNMNEFSPDDFYHSFRKYDLRMLPWIENTPEGCSAFDNKENIYKPHKIVNGKYVLNSNKNGDKYKRQLWDSVAPCIHTRNDQLASQNTVHPKDNRVFSIRELMIFMTIPENFKWIDKELSELNLLNQEEKEKILRQNEINIRQSIGEAVPTIIFNQIAKKIKKYLNTISLDHKSIISLIENENLYSSPENLISFLKINKYKYDIQTLMKIAELSNQKREENAAFYTDSILLKQIENILIKLEDKKYLNILEPSVGIGSFLPIIFNKFQNIEKVNLDLVDIDINSLKLTRFFISIINPKQNFVINFIHKDFLSYADEINTFKYNLVIGNPPFGKHNNDAQRAKDKSALFLENALRISDNVLFIMPKSLLSGVSYNDTRKMISDYKILDIIDFGEIGFKNVLIETIAIFINVVATNELSETKVYSVVENEYNVKKQNYITDKNFPTWIIYRNKFFDDFIQKIDLNIFDVYRDRQITNKMIVINDGLYINKQNYIPIIKSRNISDNGHINFESINSYIEKSLAEKLSVSKYLTMKNIYMTPNMTYKTRVARKPNNVIVNGSVALLLPKQYDLFLNEEDLLFFSSDDFRKYMFIARNKQTRTLNIDKNSIFYFGIRKR